MPASRIFCLARTSRCAIASSLARKARATCAVDSPQTVRKVSATWTSAAKDGWQQVKISRSMSSSSTASWSRSGACGVEQQFVRQLALLVAEGELPADTIDRLVAPDIDQPGARIGRQSVAGQRSSATANASCNASSREIEIADAAGSASPATRPASSRNIFSMSAGVIFVDRRSGADRGANLRRAIHIGEVRNSGFDASHRPGMTDTQLYTMIGRTSNRIISHRESLRRSPAHRRDPWRRPGSSRRAARGSLRTGRRVVSVLPSRMRTVVAVDGERRLARTSRSQPAISPSFTVKSTFFNA